MSFTRLHVFLLYSQLLYPYQTDKKSESQIRTCMQISLTVLHTAGSSTSGQHWLLCSLPSYTSLWYSFIFFPISSDFSIRPHFRLPSCPTVPPHYCCLHPLVQQFCSLSGFAWQLIKLFQQNQGFSKAPKLFIFCELATSYSCCIS